MIKTHDNTMMSDYAYCERLYALKHVRNMRRREVAPALSFGKLLHKAMDTHYSGIAMGKTAEQVVRHTLEVINDASYDDPAEGHRTKGRALQVYVAYVERYGTDSDWEIFLTETPFDVVTQGMPWGGIVDLIVKWNDKYWIVDHKSTSRYGSFYFDDFKRAPQMLGYTDAGSALHGKQLSGVIINTLIVRKNDTDFARRPILYPEWMLQEARDMQAVHYTQIEGKRAETKVPSDVWNPDIWKPNLYNCVGKYGRCQMYEVCDSRPENRERVLGIECDEHEWDWRNIDDDE